MTISSTTNRVSYTGNGSTTAFSFPYKFFAQADLVVLETVIATGVQTVKTLTTDYTITGTTDATGAYPNGGTVNANTAPDDTVTWTIYRDPALKQLTEHVDNDPLPASSIDNPLDLLTAVAQRSRELINRSLRQPDGDASDVGLLPAKVDRASKVLAFDANGNPVVSTETLSDIEGAATSAAAAAASAADAVAAETDAAASAAAAAAAALLAEAAGAAGQAAVASVGFDNVVFITASDSPLTVTGSDSGNLYSIDTSAGDVVVTLPQISTLTLPFTVGFKKATSDENTVTINCNAADDFTGGGSSKVIDSQFGTTLIPSTTPTPDEWAPADWAGAAIADGSITERKLALDVDRVKASIITAKGDLIVGTASATVARKAIGTDGQMLMADATQASGMKWTAPVFTKSAVSAETAFTMNSIVTIAHGLGVNPFGVSLVLVNTIAEGDYTSGDEIEIGRGVSTPEYTNSNNGFITVLSTDAINVTVGVQSAVDTILFPKKSTAGAAFQLTPANWRIKVKSWAANIGVSNPSGIYYDVPLAFAGGPPTASQVLSAAVVPRDVAFPADFAGSAGYIGTDPTASFVISVQDDGTEIGTITISTGGVFTFATTDNTAKTVASGSRLEFIAPGTTDATAAYILATLAGTV